MLCRIHQIAIRMQRNFWFNFLHAWASEVQIITIQCAEQAGVSTKLKFHGIVKPDAESIFISTHQNSLRNILVGQVFFCMRPIFILLYIRHNRGNAEAFDHTELLNQKARLDESHH